MSEMTPEIAKRVDQELKILERGAAEIYSRDELKERLARSYRTGKPLRVKFGMDPTAPDIHLGHTVVMRKMRQFQDLGHKGVLIVGDYTARVGDPSGQNKTRPVLTPEAIEQNSATYIAQAGKVLDLAPEKLEIRRNGEWLAGLSFADVIRLTSKMTVARMLERDTFAIRFKAGDPIGTHELLYPLIQGYDSMMIEADVELGGTDQTFNCLVGRDLQRDSGQPAQIVLTMPILVGLDGVQKMSKSKGNYIGVTEPPAEMFGKVMSIPDNLMDNYYELLTTVGEAERGPIKRGEVHPRQAKARLGSLIVEQFYNAEAGREAAAEFDRVFARKELPTDLPEVTIAAAELAEDGVWIARLMCLCDFAKSNSEAMRLVKQGGVTIDEQVIADERGKVEFADGAILKVGKRRFARLRRG